MSHPAHEKKHTISRRQYIAGAVSAVAVVAFAERYGDLPPITAPAPTEAPPHHHPVHESKAESYKPTFSDQRAERVARQLSINPGTYYHVSAETVSAMTGGYFLRAGIVPTFPPAVRHFTQTIEFAAEKAKVPTNVLAAIATIESAGDRDAHSEDDAWGLFQVVPEFHLPNFVNNGFLPDAASYSDYTKAKEGKKSHIPLDKYQKAFLDPHANAVVGAEFLADCVELARKDYPDLDPNSPDVFAWAGSLYNAGPSYAGSSFDNLPLQSQLYSNHMIRMLMDVEIAARLKDQGLDDHEVVKSMWSDEMNARAYSFYEIGQRYPMDTFYDYNQRAQADRSVIPGKLPDGQFLQLYGQTAYSSYNDYNNGTADIQSATHQYTIPAAPGLRIWLAGGGESLFAAQQSNADWSLSS